MTMGEADECSYAATDSAVRYVARSLSASQEEAFEEHLFTCDRCFNEARLGLEIKAAASPRSGGLAGPALRRVLWRPLAIAAALAAVLLGAWQLQRSNGPAVDGVTRGGGARALAVQARSGADAVEVSWTPVPRADVYRVEVSSGEGALLLKREVPGTSLSMRRDDLAAAAGGALYVRVTALDSLRQEIAASSPVSIGPPFRRD
jgi:hypothetical protein